MRLLIIFVLMLSNSFASDATDIKNLVINKELKNYSDITFLNIKNKELYLNDYKGNLVLLNFWATWCAPCKEEMPSLDSLLVKENLKNLRIFPINIGQDKIEKAEKFFKDLGIKNLEIYFNNNKILDADKKINDLDFKWKDIAFIPQSAMNSLDPVYRIIDQMREILVI